MRTEQAAPASGLRRTRRVLVLGGDATWNLGDRAILEATCRLIHSIDDGIRITVVLQDGTGFGETEEWEHRVDVVPKGVRGVPALRRIASESDLVLCGGGGLFQDDDSLVKVPYWYARVGLVSRHCPRVVGYSLGVGPLRSRVGRALARRAFARMERVSARDPLARRLAMEISGGSVELVPDPALLLAPADPGVSRARLRAAGVPLDGRPLLGLAPRRFFPPRSRLVPHAVRWQISPRYRRLSADSLRLAGRLASVLDDLIDRHRAHVVMLPSYARDREGDVQMSVEIRRRMRRDDASIAVIRDPSLYKGITGELELMIGGRLHPTIFAAACGTAIVGLAYNPKFRGFFRLMDLERRVLDVATFLEDDRREELRAMSDEELTGEANPSARAAELARAVERFVGSLLEPIHA